MLIYSSDMIQDKVDFKSKHANYGDFTGGSVVKNPPAMQEPQETQV